MFVCLLPLIDPVPPPPSAVPEDLSGIPFRRLLTVLHSCKELHYRSSEMLNDVSEYAASMVDIWSNKQVGHLKKHSRVC